MNKQNAQCAGALRVLELLGNHEAAKTAQEFIDTLNGIDDYDGSDPAHELSGVANCLVYLHENYKGFGKIGNAASIVKELEEKIHASDNKPKTTSKIRKSNKKPSKDKKGL